MFEPRKPMNPRLSQARAKTWVGLAKAQRLVTRARSTDTGKLGLNLGVKGKRGNRYLTPEQRKTKSRLNKQISKQLIRKGVYPSDPLKAKQKVRFEAEKMRKTAARKMGRQISQEAKATAKAAQAKTKAQQKARQTAFKSLAQKSKYFATKQAKTQKALAKTAAQEQQAKEIKQKSNRLLAARLALKGYRKFVMTPASKMASYGRWNSSLW